MKKYLKHGSPDVTDNTGKTLLHYAVIYDNFEIALLLVNAKIAIDKTDLNGNSALHFAAQLGKINFLKLLLKFKANNYLLNNKGEIPLFLAVLKGNIEAVALFFEEETDYRRSNHDQENILFYAVRSGSVSMLTYLLQKTDLNVNTVNFRKDSLLHIAVKANSLTVTAYLIGQNVRPFKVNNQLETPLFSAVRNENLEMCQLLIDNGALLENVNKDNKVVMNIYDEENPIFEYLQKRLNSYKYNHYWQSYPLHCYLKIENYEKVKVYLKERKNYPELDSFNVSLTELIADSPDDIKKLFDKDEN
ncbi:MAG: ankyrin repeat domain-containing protein [Erysipelotrichales bacterium]|nr:ankyrin repeat domain-containing protein [Erysipelotrichales bacterium]